MERTIKENGEKKGVLYVIATPIGNLKDLTIRALDTLRAVSVIYSEDTRVTIKLLNHYGITKPLFSFHGHSSDSVYAAILSKLRDGASIALVTDAGTPGISDPGNKLIKYLRSNLAEPNIIPIPGPSAITTALSVSGIESAGFTFLGYPPMRKGREKFFAKLKEIETRPIVLYESKHRIKKTLSAIQKSLGEETKIILACDLTKFYEKVSVDNVSNILQTIELKEALGEFVVVIE